MFQRIRPDQTAELAKLANLRLDDAQAAEFHTLFEYIGDVIDGLDALAPAPQGKPNAPARRDPGRRATPADDPYNAVVRWVSVKQDGTAGGLLEGVRIGTKDSIGVAGIPLTAGSDAVDYVPSEDAEVVRRILAAGAEINSVLNMDYFAFSGGGDTSAYGPTKCPHDVTRTAAGSSGGSGAALFYDDVDMTLGCDQGGSIRLPAAWCGVLGLKPTYGLVPYTGILGLDFPIDHCGPMTRSAGDMARLLQVIAGADGRDHRQPPAVPVQDYLAAVANPGRLDGVRLAVVTEGMSADMGVEPEVADAIRAACDRLAKLGAEITEVSIPEHLASGPLAVAGFIEGMTALLAGGGNGHHHRGIYDLDAAEAFGEALRERADRFSNQVKLTLMFGTYMQRQYAGTLYGKAHNLHGWLRGAYDRVLGGADALVMPAAAHLPHKIDPSLSISERVMRGWSHLANCCGTNPTGHPALSMPAAEANGLPVGFMLIGRRFDDARLLRIAAAYENAHGWHPQHPGDPRR